MLCPIDAQPGAVLELKSGFETIHADEPAQLFPENALEALAKVGKLNATVLANNSAAACRIVTTISEATYLAADLYQLGWAYKFSVFEDAAIDCYLSRIDFFDSSKYDNCDGIPRFDKGGFVQWASELNIQREKILEEMKVDGWEEKLSSSSLTEQSESDYAKLTDMVLSGDDKSFIDGLREREKQVSMLLQNLQSRYVVVTKMFLS